jgi:hypothetical protein
VFKIQANMDKRHRDRLAFMRITSGVFEKDMPVQHARLGREVRMTRPHRLFARERETIERAYPGDVIGFVNPGLFQIGDAVSSDAPVEFDRIPRFAPEYFATLRAKQSTRQKQFQKGLEQLEEEGAMQVFVVHEGLRSEPILAVVGELQFDVLQSRLETEYAVETNAHHALVQARPLGRSRRRRRRAHDAPRRSRVATDRNGRAVVLFTSDWELDYAQKENPMSNSRALRSLIVFALIFVAAAKQNPHAAKLRVLASDTLLVDAVKAQNAKELPLVAAKVLDQRWFVAAKACWRSRPSPAVRRSPARVSHRERESPRSVPARCAGRGGVCERAHDELLVRGGAALADVDERRDLRE